jgi:hypothetical protein
MTSLANRLSQSWPTLAVYLPVFVLVVALAVRDRRKFGANWPSGLLVAIIWFLLCLPLMVYTLTHADFLGAAELGGASPEGQRAAVVALYAGLMVGFTLKVVQVPWYTVVYHVAAEQWGAVRPDAFPIVQQRRPVPWRAIAGAGAFGVGAAVVSAGVFRLFHVAAPDALKQFSAAMPAAAQSGLWVRLVLLGLAAAGTALADELLLRGALLGWLLRSGGNRRVAAVEAAVLVSVFGACAAMVSAHATLAQGVQVFVIGLFLCEFARRSCIEAAVAAHVGLNVAALLISAAMG